MMLDKTLDKSLLYARTALHLEPRQIYARLRPRPAVSYPRTSLQLRPLPGGWVDAIPRESPQMGLNRFRFLNQEREIQSWNDPLASRLWLYNLHYFEHVNEDLVHRWITENAPGRGSGWDPYPMSLRIANWCKWILAGARPGSTVIESLALQAASLYRRLEWHLLANHLLANAKALLFAGCVLHGSDADRWRRTGANIIERELPRQILADGGHVERSPMYHSIVLEDLLDLCNLRGASGGLVPDTASYASRMLGWLDRMTHPDGRISFFNDAALGVAPEPHQLADYSRRLGTPVVSGKLGASGYIRLENDKAVVIFDAAPLGPDYQPGHGHADALSFELSVRGRRVLVNCGTSTYDDGPERAYQRGTASHNTVRVDECDQSEMWAVFRVARRARPFDVRTDHQAFAEGAHNGYHRLRRIVTHRRRLDLLGDALVVTDALEGAGRHTAELFFHMAPCASPGIEFDPKVENAIERSTYHPGFNLAVSNFTAVGRWRGDCPVTLKTRISLSERSPRHWEHPERGRAATAISG